MEGEFPLSRYIYEGLSSPPPPLFPNYISAFQSEINGVESSSCFGAYSVYGGYNEADLCEFQRNRLQQSSNFINGDYNNQNLMRSLIVSGSGFDENVVKMEQQQQQPIIPKSELFDDHQGWMTNLIEPTPLNYLRGSSIQNLNSGFYHQFPVLCSLEQIMTQASIPATTDVSEPSLKRFRSSTESSSFMEMPIQQGTNLSLSNPNNNNNIPFLSLSSLIKSSPRTPSVTPSGILASERRKLISDRIRCLQKLMPWDKKMDMATLLEEAYKYIKFLQAQVSVLQAMPCQSSFITTSTASSSSHQNYIGSGLEKLNRQQLLKVLISSPVAQTSLYSKGFCVYSLEQLILLKKIAAHRILLQQMLMARSTSTSTSSSSSVYSRDAGRRF